MIIKDLIELMNDAELQFIIFSDAEDEVIQEKAKQLYSLLNTDVTTHNMEALNKFVQENKRFENVQKVQEV